MDPAEAEFNLISCNGDYALNVCSMGLDARIGTEASRYKHFPLVTGPGAYGLSALANIIKGVHRPYRIALNGEYWRRVHPDFCRQRPLVWQRIPPCAGRGPL